MRRSASIGDSDVLATSAVQRESIGNVPSTTQPRGAHWLTPGLDSHVRIRQATGTGPTCTDAARTWRLATAQRGARRSGRHREAMEEIARPTHSRGAANGVPTGQGHPVARSVRQLTGPTDPALSE